MVPALIAWQTTKVSTAKFAPGHFPAHPDQKEFRQDRFPDWSYGESNPGPTHSRWTDEVVKGVYKLKYTMVYAVILVRK